MADDPPSPRPHLRARTSQWSVADTPQHHHQGTSYFPPTAGPSTSLRTPSPILARTMSYNGRRMRSTSRSSRLADENEDEEEEEEEDEEPESSSLRRSRPTAEEAEEEEEEDPITLKDRQSLINVEHPFGLPIWKPALYKKSRTVTRNADEALHATPSAQAERHLLPGNIFWAVAFGWWLAVICVLVAAVLFFIPKGGRRYAELVYGLGWYLAWPFGKYVEGVDPQAREKPSDEEDAHTRSLSETSEAPTVRGQPPAHTQSTSWVSVTSPGETTSLLERIHSSYTPRPIKSYGAARLSTSSSNESLGSVAAFKEENRSAYWLGKACFWLLVICIIAPILLLVCLVCWMLVVTIPMARLNWHLLKHLFDQPDTIRFCAAPPAFVVPSPGRAPQQSGEADETPNPSRYAIKHARLSAGQAAPSGFPTRTVLLCTYRAIGWQYYKYTIGGVNIFFVLLLPIVFFAIFDGFILLPIAERLEKRHEHVPALLEFLTSGVLLFVVSLASVIPLSYFIGMAVASISAQSSIGMGAVINATFGSIIEIILYGIALTQQKGHLVEGSIIGSILAGVLLMPGLSMISGAVRKKELKFNAKSAGVTSVMLIMAIIGTLTPTMFYQTYGSFVLICNGCPSQPKPNSPSDARWRCDSCYYEHPDPVNDPFYQSTVKSLMYFCATILLFSYLIGLWFSLRTHASQIWQNPQQLLHPMELPSNSNRQSYYPRPVKPLSHKPSIIIDEDRSATPVPRDHVQAPPSPTLTRRISHAGPQPPLTPVLESVKHTTAGMKLPENMTTEDFTRAVAVATVSALRQQPYHPQHVRVSGGEPDHGGHGGHDGPAWSRTTSASVLLACTFLYALIAEILVDVVDVILKGSGIDEKFLGVTLFALVPNTTEFMNAMSFALTGNISLSMEIGSAYALQVCLLQIPAMVAFSAWYAPEKMGEVASTFTLIFPRWDVIVIILSMFLMTYTYIEAKSNYHRGSILTLSYLVLTAGFYFAPHPIDDNADIVSSQSFSLNALQALWYSLSSVWA